MNWKTILANLVTAAASGYTLAAASGLNQKQSAAAAVSAALATLAGLVQPQPVRKSDADTRTGK